MGAQIKTRWHKLVDAVLAGRIQISDTAESSVHYKAVPEFMLDKFVTLVKLCSGAPFFFVERTLVRVLETPEARASVDAMEAAGVLRLPYESCVVELEGFFPHVRHYIIVVENRPSVIQAQDYNLPFVMQMLSLQGDDVVVSPMRLMARWDKNNPQGAAVRFDSQNASFMRDSVHTGEMVRRNMRLDPATAGVGLFTMLLLVHTRGVAKDVSTPDARLNRSRTTAGRAPIPAHTILRIGHAYNRSGVKTGVTRETSKEVRMVRGHAKNQAHGPAHSLRKLIFIEPYLVNYDPASGPAPTPVYEVRS